MTNTLEARKAHLYTKTNDLVLGMYELADDLDLSLEEIWQFIWVYANTRSDDEVLQ